MSENLIIIIITISKLYYDRSIIRVNDRNNHKNRPDIPVVIIGRTIKEAYLKDVAVPKSHNIQSTRTERFQKYKRTWKKKRAYENMATENGLCNMVCMTHSCYHPK